MTFDTDVADPAVIRRSLLSLTDRVAVRVVDRVAVRLRGGGHVGRTVALKVRLAAFRTVDRSRTLPGTTDVAGRSPGRPGGSSRHCRHPGTSGWWCPGRGTGVRRVRIEAAHTG